MKTAVVFYTHDGSTREAASIIAQKLGADIFELEEIKARGHSTGDFIRAGFGAALGTGSKLVNNYAQETKEYDLICIGTPVWASKATPAVNTFVRTLDAAGKQFVIFTLQADPNTETLPGKCGGILQRTLEKKGAAGVRVVRLHGAGVGETAKAEELQRQIDENNIA